MHRRVVELIGYLDAQRALLRAAFDAVPPSLRGFAPNPDCWSAANIVEHLAIVEGRVARRLQSLIDAARAAGAGPDMSSDPILPTLPLQMVATRARRVAAPEPVRPTGLDADAAWAALEHATPRVHAALRAGEAVDLTQVSMPHPLFGPLTAYAWFGFIGAHEARHAAQIRETYGISTAV